MCAGRRINAEDIYPAQDMFVELLYESSQYQSQGGEPWPSVGEFIRSEVGWATKQIILAAVSIWEQLPARLCWNISRLLKCPVSSILTKTTIIIRRRIKIKIANNRLQKMAGSCIQGAKDLWFSVLSRDAMSCVQEELGVKPLTLLFTDDCPTCWTAILQKEDFVFCFLLSGAGATASSRAVERHWCSHKIFADECDQ